MTPGWRKNRIGVAPKSLQCNFKRRASWEKSGSIILRENSAMEMTVLTGIEPKKLRRDAAGIQAEKALLVPSQRSLDCVKAAA